MTLMLMHRYTFSERLIFGMRRMVSIPFGLILLFFEESFTPPLSCASLKVDLNFIKWCKIYLYEGACTQRGSPSLRVRPLPA
jgi:hypothetical protein